MATIALRGVEKTYGTNKVVHGIDCAIADGEFVVILGPSGCGKSTLLRMIAGLEEISGGEIAIDGRVINQLEPKDRDIAMVFQNYALYPHMSVYDNMAYGLKLRGLPKAEIDRRVRETADILELGALLERKPRQLSGGQRQRVAMGRAIVREPKAFLFDEPLSNLDAKLRVQMRLEIKRLQRRLGITSVYVTHDQVEAMTLGDRLLVMNDGRVEQAAAPLTVYDRPATTFVAGFIGTPPMNFLAGRVEGSTVQVEGLAPLTLPDRAPGLSSGQSVTVGVRPEHLQIATNAPQAILEVEIIEPLGAETLVHGRIGPATAVARLDHGVRVKPGDRIPVAAALENLHLFDSSGKRTEIALTGTPLPADIR